MKYLIYEMFSGVGFCNQLFSFETAIYMANTSNRKLILLIKNPLCHCGQTSWEFGHFLDYFSDRYLEYLPNAIQVIYGRNDDKKIIDIIADKSLTKHIVYKDRFSNVVFIDKELDTIEEDNNINQYLKGRHKQHTYFDDNENYQYIYINQSNASRIFYNFYTNDSNIITINNIAYSLTKLNPNIEEYLKTIKLPDKFVAIHLRFGDKKHDVSIINNRTKEYLDNINFNLIKSVNLPVIVMCDRKDSNFLSHFKNNNIDIIFTDTLIGNNYKTIDTLSQFKRREVVEFLIEKYICENSDIFIANSGSTVSNYINYIRFINNKSYCNLYSNTSDKKCYNNIVSFIDNQSGGGNLLSWKSFWTNNVIKNPYKYKIITLTNNGYKELTENLLLSMKKIGILHSIKIYCLDIDCFNYFNQKYIYNDVELINNVESKLANWIQYTAPQSSNLEGKKIWAEVTKYKIIVINYELNKGNDVIFIDGDIIINQPFVKDLYNNIGNNDIIIQSDNAERGGRDCMCTGFFLMKSNKKTIETTNFNNIDMENFPNDQQYLRWAANKYCLTYKYLDLDLYPNGKYYRTYKPISNIVHFNYDSGHGKIKRMKDFNVYYVSNPIHCMTFYDWLSYDISPSDIIINSSVQDLSDRLTNLPIGVQHDYLKYYFDNHNNEFINNPGKNTALCLESFARNTDRNRRGEHAINRYTITANIGGKTFITKQRYDGVSYFKNIGKFKFVICPEGNGIDTHRLWETLYSKGIPIVENNEIMRKKLEGLPILWTNNYSELTEDYLNSKYEEILKTNYDFSYLMLSFYSNKCQSEIIERSKFWCFKRNLGDLFNKYYSNISINTFNKPDVIDKTQSNILPNNLSNLSNRSEYFALKDGTGIPLDKKLDNLFNKTNGVFIDVGAHDGIQQSCTCYLEKHKKWNGILITPNRDKFFECVKNRPDSLSKQFACVEPTYTQNMISGDFWKLSGSRNGTKNNTNRIENVPCNTLTTIIDMNALEFRVKYNKDLYNDIDIIKIDTTTHEYEVLLGLDLNKYKPKYILIEILKEDYTKITEYLNNNSYKLHSNFSYYTKENHRRWDGTHNDYLFVRGDTPQPPLVNVNSNINESPVQNITLTINELNHDLPTPPPIITPPSPPPPPSPATSLETKNLPKSLSQINQDINIIEFYNQKRGGFFVDVGAYDGIKFSNTYLLEKEYNWNGICIEPGRRFYQKLIDVRSTTCIECAIYRESGLELEFIDCGDDDEKGSMLSGLSLSASYRTKNNAKETYLVKTKTLNEILIENNAPNFIDYISIDVEGAETSVLMSIDFNKYTFGYITIEFNNNSYLKGVIDNILTANGYIFKQINKFDIDYIHNSVHK